MPKAVLGNRDAWLAARRDHIGASEAAAALGLSPWCSPYKLAKLKRGEISDKLDLGELGEWGLRHEPTIAQAVRDRVGRDVRLTEPFSMVIHDSAPCLSASPDAFMKRGPGETHLPRGVGVLQIKTAGAWSAKEWEDGPPEQYIVQLQQEIDVTGVSWGSLVVLIGGNRLRGPYDYVVNDDWLATATPRLVEFWERYVLRGEELPADGSEATASALAALYPNDSGEVVRLEQEFEAVATELESARADKKSAKDRETAAKNKLAQRLGASSIGILPDGRQVSYRTIDRAEHMVRASASRVMRILK